ncbi:aminoglycoside phosphotransferase family protein [Streptomyces sp. VRA16 Mangrove soil]|uniref:aminoglycoside phosphotransferase family protein n=1 Tax=Streptomyces sp. VRA16 Mangrove soil TaxID=2817434 RepID=UPI001A9D82B5|nr:aminoglycoside phosphotransferase family protein [Streptomyces sp. VRA16 Mangrove soil]MBO1331753.1 aminoglycoside phosphotransferase family protein [Streptomyces sp. VRA16 Mangrove soil]
MTQAPPATGRRTPWAELPAHVKNALTDKLGAEVTRAETRPGGFSPGVAASVTLADGRHAFVKAVSAETNPHSPGLHRAEARHAAALPPDVPAPRLLATYDDGTWVALAFERVPGRQPEVPWRRDELNRVLDAVGELARTLTPAPFDAPPAVEALAGTFDGWRQLLDQDLVEAAHLDPWTARNVPALVELASTWAEFASGDTLAHGDLRADNMLLTPEGRVVFVDWPHVLRAAPWLDLLLMLPCVAAQGGPDPEVLFTGHPLGRDADPEGVTRTLAALTGYFLFHAALPDPPGLPTLRSFQRAQGEAALAWLKRRLRSRGASRPLVPDLP